MSSILNTGEPLSTLEFTSTYASFHTGGDVVLEIFSLAAPRTRHTSTATNTSFMSRAGPFDRFIITASSERMRTAAAAASRSVLFRLASVSFPSASSTAHLSSVVFHSGVIYVSRTERTERKRKRSPIKIEIQNEIDARSIRTC